MAVRAATIPTSPKAMAGKKAWSAKLKPERKKKKAAKAASRYLWVIWF